MNRITDPGRRLGQNGLTFNGLEGLTMQKHHVTVRATPGAPALRDVLINGHSYRIHRAMRPADADIRSALIVAQFHDMGARCTITDETGVPS